VIKLTFELYPESGHIRPYEVPFGYVFRGVIMKWLSEVKPELVHILHNYEQIRPYSIRRYIHKRVPKIDLSLTTYNENLSDALLQDLMRNQNIEFNVGEKRYYISQIRFERIYLKSLLERSAAVKSFSIRFNTPAYFNTRMGDYPVRFPLPSLLFGNLAHLWNDISKDAADIDRDQFISWVNAHVYISYYKMKTVKRNIGKPKPVYGGIGNASFNVKKFNKKYYKYLLEELGRPQDHKYVNRDYQNNCRWLEILCRLGEYTNVGANRTAGMGVIKYYPNLYLDSEDLLSKDSRVYKRGV